MTPISLFFFVPQASDLIARSALSYKDEMKLWVPPTQNCESIICSLNNVQTSSRPNCFTFLCLLLRLKGRCRKGHATLNWLWLIPPSEANPATTHRAGSPLTLKWSALVFVVRQRASDSPTAQFANTVCQTQFWDLSHRHLYGCRHCVYHKSARSSWWSWLVKPWADFVKKICFIRCLSVQVHRSLKTAWWVEPA